MTLDAGTVALVLNILSLIVLVGGGWARFARLELKTNKMWGEHDLMNQRISTLELKTNKMWDGYDEYTRRVITLWEFTYRRGAVELVQKGWGQANSPIRLKVDGFEKVRPFLEKFIPAYVRWMAEKPDITEAELAERFEHHFGDFIMEHLCLPQGLSEAACLTAIILACKTGGSDAPTPN
jgi:hypothetical protein